MSAFYQPVARPPRGNALIEVGLRVICIIHKMVERGMRRANLSPILGLLCASLALAAMLTTAVATAEPGTPRTVQLDDA
jgi:hypothetical protein